MTTADQITTSFYGISRRLGLLHQACHINANTDRVDWRGPLRLRHRRALDDMMTNSFERFTDQFLLLDDDDVDGFDPFDAYDDLDEDDE